jgi:hypothetical protein
MIRALIVTIAIEDFYVETRMSDCFQAHKSVTVINTATVSERPQQVSRRHSTPDHATVTFRPLAAVHDTESGPFGIDPISGS